MNKYVLSGLMITLFILLSGCMEQGGIFEGDVTPLPTPIAVTNTYYNVSGNFTANYSVNTTGQPKINDFLTLVEDGNVSITQDTSNHIIRIKALEPISEALIASICNPANQASSYNGTGFECVSIADTDNFEPSIASGQAYQIWIGNKTWTNISGLDVNSSNSTIFWAGLSSPPLSWGANDSDTTSVIANTTANLANSTANTANATANTANTTANNAFSKYGGNLLGTLNMSYYEILDVQNIKGISNSTSIVLTDTSSPSISLTANLPSASTLSKYQMTYKSHFWYIEITPSIVSELIMDTDNLTYYKKGVILLRINSTNSKIATDLDLESHNLTGCLNCVNTSSFTGNIHFQANNNGVVLTTGSIGNATANYNGNMTEIILLGDLSGNISIDVYKGNYSTFPTQTKIGTITVTNAQKYQDIVFSGFTTKSFQNDDNIGFVITSVANITSITGDIETVRT